MKNSRGILLFLLLIPCWVIAAQYEIDLVNLHFVAKVLHTDLTRVYAQNGTLGRYYYGPFSLILIHPLGLLSFPIVKWFWIGLQTLSYLFFWLGLFRLYPKLWERKYFWAWVVVWILAINPIHNNFQSNNIQLMLAAVLVWAEIFRQSERSSGPFVAGVLVALMAAIKLFPAFIAVLYFLGTSPKVRWGLIIGSAIALIAPFLFYGWNDGLFLTQDFYRNLTTYGAENPLNRTPDILCLPSLLERVGVSATGVRWLGIGIAALFFWVAYRYPRLHDNVGSRELWGVGMALMTFLNPSSRPHYFIFYVPAMASLAEFALATSPVRKGATAGIVLSLLLIAFTMEGVVGKHWNNQMEFWNFPTYGMAILIAMTAYLLLKRGQSFSDVTYIR